MYYLTDNICDMLHECKIMITINQLVNHQSTRTTILAIFVNYGFKCSCGFLKLNLECSELSRKRGLPWSTNTATYAG